MSTPVPLPLWMFLILCITNGYTIGTRAFDLIKWWTSRPYGGWTVLEYEGHWVARRGKQFLDVEDSQNFWTDTKHVTRYCLATSEEEAWIAIARYENERAEERKLHKGLLQNPWSFIRPFRGLKKGVPPQ